jgi:hypothetical protein
MNLLVIWPLAGSEQSSNSVANRMSDRNLTVIDFIRGASKAYAGRHASRVCVM